DHAHLETEVTQGPAQVVLDGNGLRLQQLAVGQQCSQFSESGKPSVLVIGQNDWPFPIPLVQRDGQWNFDTAAGREEVLARRIGRNELATLKSMLAYWNAQNEYADMFKDK